MKNGLRFDPRAWMPDEHAPAGVEAVQSTPPSPVETRRAFPLPAPMPRNALRMRFYLLNPEYTATTVVIALCLKVEKGTGEPWAS